MSKSSDQKLSHLRKFRFLLVLIMLTWLILGIEVMVNSLSSQNTSAISLQSDNNSQSITALNLRIEMLNNKVEINSRRIDQMSRELDLAIKNYLSPSPSRKLQNKLDGISLNEEQNDKLSNTQDQDDNQETASVTGNQTETHDNKRSFEYASFAPETITAGLSEVSDRTALLEEKIFKVSEVLQKAKSSERSNNLILAAVKLREAVKNSKDFSNELKTLKIFASDNPQIQKNISTLEKHADTGILPLLTLKEEFDYLADEITNLYRKKKENPTLLDKALIQFSDLVHVRKVDANARGNNTSDILARTYKHLLKSDLEQAANEMKSLQEDASILANTWLQQVDSYVQSQKASHDIFEYATNPTQIYEASKENNIK